jgi:hypothetical protein
MKNILSIAILSIMFGVLISFMVWYSRALDSVIIQETCKEMLFYAENIEGFEEEFKKEVARCRAVEN